MNSTKEIYVSEEFAETEEENIENEELQNEIIIHITGAVKNEGIAKVKEDARINDVIEAAGGLREDADISRCKSCLCSRRWAKNIYSN